MAFDPNQPFEVLDEVVPDEAAKLAEGREVAVALPGSNAPGFDPSQPFEELPDDGSDTSAVEETGFDPSQPFEEVPESDARLTFYTRFDDGPEYETGVTAAPSPLTKERRAEEGVTIAVDPSQIPYGSKVRIPALAEFSKNGDGVFIAHDTGAAVKKRTASGGALPVLDVFVDGEDRDAAQAKRDQIANRIGTGGVIYEVLESPGIEGKPLGPDPGFWEKVKRRWGSGKRQAGRDQLAYEAATGQRSWEEVQAAEVRPDPGAQGERWYSEGFLSAVEMVPAMMEGIYAGAERGAKYAATAAGTAAIAGQLGPQVAVPEEIVTVPGAAAAGWAVGQTSGSFEYWYRQGTGAMYADMRQEGIPHDVASGVAQAMGLPYAGLEYAQVTKLAPGLRAAARKLVAERLREAMTRIAKEQGAEYAKNVGQEVAQELVAIASEAMGEALSGVDIPDENRGVMRRIFDTAKQSALAFPFLQFPKAAVQTVGALRSPRPKRVGLEDVKVERSQAAGAVQAEAVDFSGATVKPGALKAKTEGYQRIADQFVAKQFGDGMPTVVVVPDLSVAEEGDVAMQQAREYSRRGNRIEAFYDPFRNRVVAVAENLPSDTVLKQKILHELVGHFGIEQVLRKQDAARFYSVTEGVWEKFHRSQFDEAWGKAHGYRTLEELAANYGFNPESQVGRARTAVEHLARMAEADPNVSWVRAVIARFREVLRKAFPSLKLAWSDADVLAFLSQMRRGLAQQMGPEGEAVSYSSKLDDNADWRNVLGDDRGNRHDKDVARRAAQRAGEAFRGNRFENDGDASISEISREVAAGIYGVELGVKPLYHEHYGLEAEPLAQALKAAVSPGVEVTARDGHLYVYRPEAVERVVNRDPEAYPGDTVFDKIHRATQADQNGELLGYGARSMPEGDTTVILRDAESGAILTGFRSHWDQAMERAQMFEALWQEYEGVKPRVQVTRLGNAEGVQFSMVPSQEQAEEAAAGGPEKRRKFVESVKEAEGVHESVKEKVDSFYQVFSDKDAVEQARERINRVGLEAAMMEVLDTNGQSNPPTKLTNVMGMDLLNRLQGQGRFEDAARIAQHLAEQATSQGQAIQSLHLIARLTPEGIQYYAQRTIQKAMQDAGPEVKKKSGEVRRIREEMEAVRQEEATEVVQTAGKRMGAELGKRVPAKLSPEEAIRLQTAVDEVLLQHAEQPEVAMEKLAEVLRTHGKMTRRASLRTARRAVTEFQRRLQVERAEVMRELLKAEPDLQMEPASAAALQRQMLDVMTAHEANPEAAVRELVTLLDQQGALPAGRAQRMAERAVTTFRQKMQQRRAAMMRDLLKVDPDFQMSAEEQAALHGAFRDILVRNEAHPDVAVKELVELLTQQAEMADGAAMKLAKEAVANFRRRMQQQREALLKNLLRVNVPGQELPKSMLEKWIALNKAGVLDDATMFAGIAERFGFPQFTAKDAARIKELQAKYDKATDPDLKLVAGAKMLEAIHELVPPKLWSRMASLQNMAMLLNPKTFVRNVLGNAAMMVMNSTADAVQGWVVDPMVGLVTGRRTTSTLALGEMMRGMAAPVVDMKKGFRAARAEGASVTGALVEGLDTMVTLGRLTSAEKYDVQSIQSSYRHVFGNRFMRLFEDTLTMSLSVPDRAFYQATFRASVQRQMEAARLNGELLASPTLEMVAEARMDAAKATFKDPSFLADALGNIRRAINVVSTLGKTGDYGLGNIVFPFTQVPSSILLRGVEWSPLGFINTSYEALKPVLGKREFDQKAFGEAFSRALLGTGAAALGAWLYKLGVLSALPEDDRDMEAFRRSSGMAGYRINVTELKRRMMSGNWWAPAGLPEEGDVIVNYDWLQPTAMPIAAGAEYIHTQELLRIDEAKGKMVLVGGTAQGALAGMKTLADQPLLQGLAKLAADMGNHGVFEGLARQAVGAPGVFIPTAVAQIAQLGDNAVRETRAGGFMEQEFGRLLTRLPGMAERYPLKYDAFGEAQERYQAGSNTLLNVLVNPAFVNRVRNNPVTREVEAVYRATGESPLPSPAPVKIVVNGRQIEPTNDQLADYRYFTGRFTLDTFGRLVQSPRFAELSPEYKAKVMGELVETGSRLAKMAVFGQALSPDQMAAIRKSRPEVREAAEAAIEQIQHQTQQAMPQYVRPR